MHSAWQLRFLLFFIIIGTMIRFNICRANFNVTSSSSHLLYDMRNMTKSTPMTSDVGSVTRNMATSSRTIKRALEFATHQPKIMSRLNDQHDFQFLLNGSTCGDEPVFALLLVGSHPDHRDMRDVIRMTWGNPRLPDFPFKLIFPFGYLLDQNSQLKIVIESALHGDIIQGNFLDNYHNITLRDLMAMRWAWLHCPQARFVVHIDDDMTVDVFSLVDILQEMASNQSARDPFMACMYKFDHGGVLREGKYMVSYEDHPSDVYDQYCSGWLYAFNPAMAYLLDDMALMVRPYWMNDAYITGTLMKEANQTHRNMVIRWTMSVDDMQNMTSTWKGNSGEPPPFQVGPQNINLLLTLNLHDQFLQYAAVNGTKRLPSGLSALVSEHS